MKYRGTAVRLMVSALVVLLAAAVASADDPKKPAAISASTSSSATSKAPASAKPAAVQASTGKTLGKLGEFGLATHLEVVEAYVPLMSREGDAKEVAYDLDKASVTVVGHDGVEATISLDEWENIRDGVDRGWATALQILVEQGYFKYEANVGFTPTDKYKTLRGTSVSGSNKQSDSPSTGQKNQVLGSGESLNLTPTNDSKMVDPGKNESVVEDPSQKGGLFGYTIVVEPGSTTERFVAIEDFPTSESSISAKVKLSRTNSSNWHPDCV